MQFIIVGIGGQGILFTSKILGNLAISRDQNIIGSEVHGMAQRGGSVISHFKIGDHKSPLVKTGEADVLIAFDQDEGIRNLPFLKNGGIFVVNVHNDKAFENKNLNDYMTSKSIICHKLYGYRILDTEMDGKYLFLNVLIMGKACACGINGLEPAVVRKVLEELAPPKFLSDNLKVFDLGLNA
ncbi:MAG: 2-oxoacid:acceptor oxidoreductase family protein [Synergistaceae bacterium]|nr:2-oxoacid:acceptor oxidoreductase family protein [Synergistaceae bacterium]